MNWTHFPPAQSVSGSTGCQQRQPLGLALTTPRYKFLDVQTSSWKLPRLFPSEQGTGVTLVRAQCFGHPALLGAVAQAAPGCCRVWELSCFHSYQCVRKVTQSSRIQRFMLQMEYAVFLQECTSEVITLSVNSGELSTSNDRAIMCWPLPKIIQQLFQLFCHPKKTLFQFQLAGF